MNILGDILGAVEGKTEQHESLATHVLDMLNPSASPAVSGGGVTAPAGGGGLTGLIEQMSANGLGHIVQSWVGTGANLPISAEQIRSVLGSDVLQSLASKVGIHVDSLAPMLAQILPGMVDKLTPGGQLPGGGATPAAAT